LEIFFGVLKWGMAGGRIGFDVVDILIYGNYCR